MHSDERPASANADRPPAGSGQTTTGPLASGLATRCLRSAIHDLRGSLNTISILHEILRLSPIAADAPQRDALATAVRAVRGLDNMLRRLRTVADSMAPALRPVRIAPLLEEAVQRAPGDARPTTRSSGTQPGDLTFASCAERLPRLLDVLLICGREALPSGGTLHLGARQLASVGVVELRGSGGSVVLPPSNTAARLSPESTAEADWFVLSCLVAGLAAELEFTAADREFTVRVQFPTTDSPDPETGNTC